MNVSPDYARGHRDGWHEHADLEPTEVDEAAQLRAMVMFASTHYSPPTERLHP